MVKKLQDLARRLRNLWRLSEYEPLNQGYQTHTGEVFIPGIKPIDQAKVITKTKTLDQLADELNG